jgi:putative heme-binding domain-containing protein
MTTRVIARARVGVPLKATSRSLLRCWLAAAASVAVAADRVTASPWEQAAEAMPVATGSVTSTAGSAFDAPEGFAVERLFVVPRDELGSWVALAADDRGRLIACDQEGRGLVRITPAPLDRSEPTRVERIELTLKTADSTGGPRTPVSLSAQGLVWAFGGLYAVVNGGPASGLYRITDADGDDRLDTVEKLRALDGAGEHGPHAVMPDPRGERLFIVCGNHTRAPIAIDEKTPPQTDGGIRADQRRMALAGDGRSRVPVAWDEDLLIERMWDANGHAVGVLAPGGFVVSTDPEGRGWELWSAGYRNPYDMAFNADGELFVYDADMEWDLGTPWYRPTRVNHATSGSELGWRSGSGKWPAAYPDSLPPLLDIGPGSPVGVAFGYGARFPERYQRALYLCDWTFGTIHAVHLQPEGSSYRATRETFLARAPLPLTDIVVAADGALYFTVGGRGAQSELYRVTYAGDQSTDPIDPRDPTQAAARGTRRALEEFHRPVDDPAVAVAAALPALADGDRFVRYAARVALEHQPRSLWQEAALAHDDPRARIHGAIAVSRQADPSDQPAVLSALDGIEFDGLEPAARIDLVRAYQLAIIRLGEPAAESRARIAARFAPYFPAVDFDLDRELASLLVAVRAPGIVSTLTGLLAGPASPERTAGVDAAEAHELRSLAARNAHFGEAVRESLERPADLRQVHYAYVLRTVREPELWTSADRRAYFAWFPRAATWGGGHSYRKFLDAIEETALTGLSDTERMALEATGVRKPWVPPPLPAPEGPGRVWTTAEVLELLGRAGRDGLAQGRDFERGRQAFAAARCVVCHRYGGDGGATGPDLTQSGGRFSPADVVEAIVEPSRVVSDQYRSSIVQTADGRVITGRIVAESPQTLTLVVDPENATRVVEVSRSEIEAIAASPVSPMPAGLLDGLNEREVLDLVAYLLARNDPGDARFRDGE